jgi:hypothetical protein
MLCPRESLDCVHVAAIDDDHVRTAAARELDDRLCRLADRGLIVRAHAPSLERGSRLPQLVDVLLGWVGRVDAARPPS